MQHMEKKESEETEEESAEGVCFVCKDGGDLRICDFKKCSKAYHPGCVKKDDSFLDDDNYWKCGWHACLYCPRVPKFRCYCCPKAVCSRCSGRGDLTIVKDDRGFCENCLTILALIEGTKTPTPGQEVDFDEQDTYEHFFKNYWEREIKNTEGLTREHLITAEKRFYQKSNCDAGLDPVCDDEEESSGSSWNALDEDDVNFGEQRTCRRRPKVNKAKPPVKMGKFGSKREQFTGWGSKKLFDFLASIGEDTSQKLAEHAVSSIIMRYAAENNLFNPEKKNTILCDPKLYKLLGRKSVSKKRMHGHLLKHFADNQSDDDIDLAEELDYIFLPDDEENAEVTRKKQRFSISEAECQEKEAVPLVPFVRRSCFASVTAQNIKLVYLRRNVVEELSKESENFDAKVIGSFVRVKADPYDYSQNNSHLLVQIRGVKRTRQNGDSKDSILLQVSDMMGEIPICKLADENFTEEECQDLHRRVKDGSHKRPLVVEFEEKARILHEAITKDWIRRELVLLKRLIDQANVKGWRKELSEYLERLTKLQKPEEQSRLLQEIPEVVADEEEVEPASEEVCRRDEQEVTGSQEIAPIEAKEVKQLTRGSRIYWCATSGADVAGDEAGDNCLSGLGRCVRSDKDAKSREEKSENMKMDGEGDEVGINSPSGLARCVGLDKAREVVSKTTKTDRGGHEAGDTCPSGVVSSPWSEKVDEDQSRDLMNKNTQPDHKDQQPRNTAYETREDGMLEKQNQAAKKYQLEHQANVPVLNKEQVELLKPLNNNGNIIQHPSSVQVIQLVEADDAVSATNNGGGSSAQANAEVIELSDDDEDDDSKSSWKPMARQQTTGLNLSRQVNDMNARIWNCMDGKGAAVGGPFSMVVLKQWKETSTGPRMAQFKVWREGQSKEEAVVLEEAIRQVFGPRL